MPTNSQRVDEARVHRAFMGTQTALPSGTGGPQDPFFFFLAAYAH